MNHRHTFMHFIITLMFAIPMMVLAAPPPGVPASNNAISARVADLEALIIAQQDMIDNLITRLACVSSASNSTELIFDGCNVNVRNGVGQTNSVNGLGNLIVGYNEDGGATLNRSGSHNLVVNSGVGYNDIAHIYGHVITLTSPLP